MTCKRATIVGEVTGGGAHPIDGHPAGSRFIIVVPGGQPIHLIRPERLREALERAHAEQPSAPRLNTFMCVPANAAGWCAVDLRLIESESNYSRLHFGEEHPLILRSLAALQGCLDNRFFGANRSQILNLCFVTTLDLEPDGSLRATLKYGTEGVLSRRRSQLLKGRMMLESNGLDWTPKEEYGIEAITRGCRKSEQSQKRRLLHDCTGWWNIERLFV